jgi:hypothetical protein
VPRGKPTGRLGHTWGGDSSSLLGWIQGRVGIRAKAKNKKKILLDFQIHFTISNKIQTFTRFLLAK